MGSGSLCFSYFPNFSPTFILVIVVFEFTLMNINVHFCELNKDFFYFTDFCYVKMKIWGEYCNILDSLPFWWFKFFSSSIVFLFVWYGMVYSYSKVLQLLLEICVIIFLGGFYMKRRFKIEWNFQFLYVGFSNEWWKPTEPESVKISLIVWICFFFLVYVSIVNIQIFYFFYYYTDFDMKTVWCWWWWCLFLTVLLDVLKFLYFNGSDFLCVLMGGICVKMWCEMI